MTALVKGVGRQWTWWTQHEHPSYLRGPYTKSLSGLCFDRAPWGPASMSWKKNQDDANRSAARVWQRWPAEAGDEGFRRQRIEERKAAREGKAARSCRALLGLWLRGKRKQRWLIKIMLALKCVWHLDEAVSLSQYSKQEVPWLVFFTKGKTAFPLIERQKPRFDYCRECFENFFNYQVN